MYEQFAQYVDRYLITEINKVVPDGDTFLDAGIVGDVRQWNCQIIAQGHADPENGDEAGFRIFELISKNPHLFAERRKAAIERHKASYPANQKQQAKARLFATA